jgi:glycosyltransferase involved in cell wall biosynthesis
MLTADALVEMPELMTSSTVASAGPRPVRVCFLMDELHIGGTESQLVALIRGLDPQRAQPVLALLKADIHRRCPLEPADCPVIRLGVRALCRPFACNQGVRFARFLKRECIDILQLYTPDSLYFGVLAGRLAGVPHIVRTRNNLNHWMTPRDRWLGRLCNRFVTRTVVNCEAARQAVLRDEAPDPHTVVVLENGVDLELFVGIPEVQGPSGLSRRQRVGVVANLRRVKGLDVFVQAAARLAGDFPNVTFHIAGEGEERSGLEQQIRELDLAGRVELCGRLRDIPGFLASLDVAVLPSRSEGMSNALLEYMAAARPIVATAVGAAPQLLVHGWHGLLVAPEDPTRLASGILHLLRHREAAAAMAAAARRRALQRYDRPAMIERFQRFFEALVFKISVQDSATHQPEA